MAAAADVPAPAGEDSEWSYLCSVHTGGDSGVFCPSAPSDFVCYDAADGTMWYRAVPNAFLLPLRFRTWTHLLPLWAINDEAARGVFHVRAALMAPLGLTSTAAVQQLIARVAQNPQLEPPLPWAMHVFVDTAAVARVTRLRGLLPREGATRAAFRSCVRARDVFFESADRLPKFQGFRGRRAMGTACFQERDAVHRALVALGAPRCVSALHDGPEDEAAELAAVTLLQVPTSIGLRHQVLEALLRTWRADSTAVSCEFLWPSGRPSSRGTLVVTTRTASLAWEALARARGLTPVRIMSQDDLRHVPAAALQPANAIVLLNASLLTSLSAARDEANSAVAQLLDDTFVHSTPPPQQQQQQQPAAAPRTAIASEPRGALAAAAARQVSAWVTAMPSQPPRLQRAQAVRERQTPSAPLRTGRGVVAQSLAARALADLVADRVSAPPARRPADARRSEPSPPAVFVRGEDEQTDDDDASSSGGSGGTGGGDNDGAVSACEAARVWASQACAAHAARSWHVPVADFAFANVIVDDVAAFCPIALWAAPGFNADAKTAAIRGLTSAAENRVLLVLRAEEAWRGTRALHAGAERDLLDALVGPRCTVWRSTEICAPRAPPAVLRVHVVPISETEQEIFSAYERERIRRARNGVRGIVLGLTRPDEPPFARLWHAARATLNRGRALGRDAALAAVSARVPRDTPRFEEVARVLDAMRRRLAAAAAAAAAASAAAVGVDDDTMKTENARDIAGSEVTCSLCYDPDAACSVLTTCGHAYCRSCADAMRAPRAGAATRECACAVCSCALACDSEFLLVRPSTRRAACAPSLAAADAAMEAAAPPTQKRCRMSGDCAQELAPPSALSGDNAADSEDDSDAELRALEQPQEAAKVRELRRLLLRFAKPWHVQLVCVGGSESVAHDLRGVLAPSLASAGDIDTVADICAAARCTARGRSAVLIVCASGLLDVEYGDESFVSLMRAHKAAADVAAAAAAAAAASAAAAAGSTEAANSKAKLRSWISQVYLPMPLSATPHTRHDARRTVVNVPADAMYRRLLSSILCVQQIATEALRGAVVVAPRMWRTPDEQATQAAAATGSASSAGVSVQGCMRADAAEATPAHAAAALENWETAARAWRDRDDPPEPSFGVVALLGALSSSVKYHDARHGEVNLYSYDVEGVMLLRATCEYSRAQLDAAAAGSAPSDAPFVAVGW